MADAPEEQPIDKHLETIPTNQQSDDMEVHHHAHHGGKRSWNSYFWEFMMLFLAVFCGFLAEYQLEHVIEHQKEKKLMRTLTADLTNDKVTLQKYIGWRTQTDSDFDSLLLMLSNPSPEANAFLVYKLINRSALRFGLPDINTGTISQLTYSGGLRLVRSSAVSDAINKHYMEFNRIKAFFETERPLRIKLLDAKAEILDAKLLVNPGHPPNSFSFTTKEPAKINHLMHAILAARQINNGLISQLDSFKVSTENLNALIGKEYHFN